MSLNFYRPTPEEFEKHSERLMPVPAGESVKRSVARTDTTYFVVNQLGISPRAWQSKFWDEMLQGNNVMVCSSRQVGKTFAVAAFALQACIYNTMPLKTTGKTRIIVVSKTEEQSKKVISDVRELMRIGDERVKSLTYKYNKKGEVTRKGIDNWFTNQIADDRNATNTKGAITFKNGCEIISLPPTERARGYTAGMLFLDEAAFFDDEEVFRKILQPIVSQTGNRVCMTSTPNGQQGFFYKYFDPEEKLPYHDFTRLWVPYTSLYLDDSSFVERMDRERNTALLNGDEKSFDQEYMASFNSSESAFFDSDSIEKSIMKDFTFPTKYDKPCDLAVDFGGKTTSRTVITITALEGEKIRCLFQYEYKQLKDLTLIDDIKKLMETRFTNIQRVIFEECPAAQTFTQAAQTLGWNLFMFNPRAEKNKKYFQLRAAFMRGKVELPMVPELIAELKGMVQEDTPTNTKIHHGSGLRDDRADSFMMSTYFFTEERATFRTWDWDEI